MFKITITPQQVSNLRKWTTFERSSDFREIPDSLVLPAIDVGSEGLAAVYAEVDIYDFLCEANPPFAAEEISSEFSVCFKMQHLLPDSHGSHELEKCGFALTPELFANHEGWLALYDLLRDWHAAFRQQFRDED